MTEPSKKETGELLQLYKNYLRIVMGLLRERFTLKGHNIGETNCRLRKEEKTTSYANAKF